jgi:hypothetical protein
MVETGVEVIYILVVVAKQAGRQAVDHVEAHKVRLRSRCM